MGTKTNKEKIYEQKQKKIEELKKERAYLEKIFWDGHKIWAWTSGWSGYRLGKEKINMAEREIEKIDFRIAILKDSLYL